jgi:hypothetical protein
VCAKLGAKVAYATGTAPKTEKMSVCSAGVPAGGEAGVASNCAPAWTDVQDVTNAEAELSGIGYDAATQRVYFVAAATPSAPNLHNYELRFAPVTSGPSQSAKVVDLFEFENAQRAFTVMRSAQGTTGIALHGEPGSAKLGFFVDAGGTVHNVEPELPEPKQRGASDLALLPGAIVTDPKSTQTFWFGASGAPHVVGVPSALFDSLIFLPTAPGTPVVSGESDVVAAGFLSSGQRRVFGLASAKVALCDWKADFATWERCEFANTQGAGGAVAFPVYTQNTLDTDIWYLAKGISDTNAAGSGVWRIAVDAAGSPTAPARPVMGAINGKAFTAENAIAFDGPNVYVTGDTDIRTVSSDGAGCLAFKTESPRQLLVALDPSGSRYIYFTRGGGTPGTRKISRHKL